MTTGGRILTPKFTLVRRPGVRVMVCASGSVSPSFGGRVWVLILTSRLPGRTAATWYRPFPSVIA